MITHKLHLDVSKDGVQGNIVLVKGERASRDISFTLSNGKNTVELGEDYSAAFRGIKPDGTELFNFCVVYTEKGVYPNTVRYHVTEQTVTAAGTFTARLLIWNREGEVLWSPEFSVTVKEHGSLDSDVESQSEFTALIDAAVQAQNAAKQTENVAAETKKEVEEWLEERDTALGAHVSDRENPHGVTAKQLGLERVNNTSDEEKPLSAAVRAAFAELGGELSATEAELIDRIAQALILAKFYADDTKVGKVGDQVIEGGLSISGDLLVGGDTFAKQIESLEVGDAVIIANADGVFLSELSGYVIRVNGDSAYAIVYDPADDCVKIGLGTYNSETKLFVFLEGEAQVLATRDRIADGHIPVWDDEKKTFKDSGKKADEFIPKDSAQLYTNALKGSAIGEAVAITDISPIEHDMRVNVKSKNIIPFPFVGGWLNTSGGVAFTYNDDNTIRVKGTTKKYSYTHLIGNDVDKDSVSPYLEDGKTYTLSLQAMNGETTLTSLIITYTEKATGKLNYVNSINPTFTVDKSKYTYDYMRLFISSVGVELDCVVGAQLEEGTATPWKPYVADTEAVKVRAQGKNLIPYPYPFKTQVNNGVSFTVNDDGTVLANGTATAQITFYIAMVDSGGVPVKEGETYTLSGCPSGGSIDTFCIQLSSPVDYPTDTGSGKTFVARVNSYSGYIVIRQGVTVNNLLFNPMVEMNSTATEREPYIEPIEYSHGDDVKSIYPCTTLTTDTAGAVIEVEYNRDINDAFAKMQQAIVLLGGII